MSDYLTFGARGVIMEVRCKGQCKTVLQKRAHLTSPLVRLPEYIELVIAFQLPNSLFGKHETAVCRACHARLTVSASQQELDAIYAEDVRQWIEAATRTGIPPMEALKMAERFASWTPLRVLDEVGSGDIAA